MSTHQDQYLIRVSAPHFVAGLVVTAEPRIIKSAPILRRYRSWPAFIKAARLKGWIIQHL